MFHVSNWIGAGARRLALMALALSVPLSVPLAAHAQDRSQDRAQRSATLAFEVDARQPGPTMNVDFIGNATRLDTLLGVRNAAALAAMPANPRTAPAADYFRTRYPHYQQFRVGNIFVGYECTASDLDELVVRGPDGRPQYRFGQTLDMLQLMLSAGIKPHLALTGTPRALVPAGEAPLKHPNYGCVNAPPMDLSQGNVRERMPEWWQLQDAFLAALIQRFGKAEVQSWTFATWTEPWNPGRKLAHLVLPADVVQAGRHDEGVATLVAASIDAAMKHDLRIRIGNLAGSVQTEYPKLVAAIARLPRGKSYLDYIDGYAISRYRTQGGSDIGRQLDAAFALLDNPAMPAKPLYLDEFGDLAGPDGAEPFQGASGLDGARFASVVLGRVFSRQNGSVRVPRGVAFWRDQIEPRPRNIFTQPQAHLKSAASHVTDFFASINGHARLPARGPADQVLAGQRDGRVKVLLLPDARDDGDAAQPQTRALAVSGLRAGVSYEVTLSEVSRLRGNPISAFLGGSAGYRQDAQGRFKSAGGRWALASPQSEACYYDENASCAWREKAREIEAPLVRSSRIRVDGDGVLRTSMVVDEAGIVMVDVAPAR